MNNNETNKIISKFTVLDHEFGSDNGWIGIPKVNTYNLSKYINSGWMLECTGL